MNIRIRSQAVLPGKPLRLFFACFIPLLLATASGIAAELARYTIVRAPDAPPSVIEAANVLQTYLQRATGHTLPIAQTPAEPMIALGDTEWSRAVGLTAEDLPWEAARIRTVGANLHIVGRDVPGDGETPDGGSSRGTFHGVLTFLERVAGVRWLMPGEHGTHVPRWERLTMPELDITDAPGFRYRRIGGIGPRPDPVNDWLRMQRLSPSSGSLRLGGSHAWHHLFPPPGSRSAEFLDDQHATYEAHPEWFAAAADGTRIRPPGGNHWSLCPTAPGLAEEIARRVGRIHEHTGRRLISIGPSDGAPGCWCAECQSRLEPWRPEYYGDRQGLSWTPIILAQYRRVAEMLQATHPSVAVYGLIYQRYGQPPRDAEPMPANFLGDVAPHPWNYGPLCLNPEVNRQFRRVMAEWHPILQRKSFWSLDTYMRQHAGAPLPVYPDLLNETLALLAEHGYEGCALYGNPGWGQSALLNYVVARLMWSPGRDAWELMREFCDAAYGPAADDVLTIYTLADRNMAAFVNANDDLRLTYILGQEMLRDVYAPEWLRITECYARALERVDTEETRWRLERLGDNLARLYYHLVVLGFIDPDPVSPLHADPSDYEARNRHLAAHPNRPFHPDDIIVGTWPWNPAFVGSAFPLKTDGIDGDVRNADAPGRIQFQFHQEAILHAPADGPVRVELAYEQPTRERTGAPLLPAIPYYAVLDEALQPLHVGIARENRHIVFPGEAGRRYWLVMTEVGMSRGMPYGVSANVPIAFGDRIAPEGMRIAYCDTPLYFHVPNEIDAFELVFSSAGAASSITVVTPGGVPAQSFEGNYRILKFERARLDNADDWDGFWKIAFETPFQHGSIRQDRALSGFFTVDPQKPLTIRRP